MFLTILSSLAMRGFVSRAKTWRMSLVISRHGQLDNIDTSSPPPLSPPTSSLAKITFTKDFVIQG